MIRKRGILTFILAAALSGICAAQSGSADLVYVNATVTGPKKVPAPGLKEENFQLLEDGVEQKITFFAANDGPWDIDLLLATSQLLPGRADHVSAAIRDAVETFQKTSNPGDKIKVEELHFGSDGLYAAIDRNLLDLQKTTNPRRALVVITDGFDKPYPGAANSAVTNVGANAGGDAANALVEYSRKLNIPIYFLYTNTTTPDTPANPGRGGAATLSTSELGEKDTLTTVADQTGGSFATADALRQLDTACKLLAEELRNKYVLGFKSTNDKKDDKWRKLKVTLKSPPAGQKLDLSAKGKYFVPKPPK